MIVVRITGGLGNQMFQYAAALALATRRETSLTLDVSFFSGRQRGRAWDGHRRKFGLGQFRIDGQVVEPMIPHWIGAVNRRLASHVPAFARLTKLHVESSSGWDDRVLRLPDNSRLEGYFQSANYFRDIASLVRSHFRPLDLAILRQSEADVAAIRRGRPVVSVHIRRGDLAGPLPTGLILQDEEYVRTAMEEFGNDVDYLVFSDDLPWCRSTFTASNIFLSPGRNVLTDLLSMAACDHHIIANSTFSWWGAWLNPRVGKKVVAPRRWFSDRPTPPALYEPDWLLIG